MKSFSLDIAEFRNQLKVRPQLFGMIKLIIIISRHSGEKAQLFVDLVNDLNSSIEDHVRLAQREDNKQNLSIREYIERECIHWYGSKVLYQVPFIINFEAPTSDSYVIDFLYKISVKNFMSTFFVQLFKDKSLRESFIKAKEQMLQALIQLTNSSINSFESFKQFIGEGPMLFPTGRSTDIDITENIREGEIEDLTQLISLNNLKQSRPFCFTGRKVELYQIFSLTRLGESVNLFGEKGVGKSAFIFYFAIQLIFRDIFKDGIYTFKLSQLPLYKNDLKILMR